MATPGQLHLKSVYRFASFELDATFGTLRKHGYRVPLQEQPFRILCLLLDRPSELITREQIRETLWAADTFVDFDRSLNKAMVKLRQALDDDADAPRFIETLPKRGYRFLLPVEVVVGDLNSVPPPNRGTTASNSQKRETNRIKDPVGGTNVTVRNLDNLSRIIRWPMRVLAIVASVGIVLWLLPTTWRDQLLPPIFRTPIRSLAVLPLENLSGDPAQDYFADGMTDELTTDLASIHSLRVVSRTTMNQYRRSLKPVPEIARELNVDAVMEGSVVRSGDNVRITIQLIDGRRDRHLWAQSYQRKLTDILEVQDAIAVDVASQVRTNVGSGSRDLPVAFAAPRSPIRPNAYDDYLRGRSELTKQNPEAMKKSAEYFQAAIDDDPQYARAYAGLADSYNFMANYQVLLTKDAFPHARAAATKALELDADSPEAHAALAFVKHHFEWDWAGAEVEYQRAIALQPNFAAAYSRYAWFLTDVGRHEDALRELRRAQELDPNSIVVATNLGRSLYRARRYDEAIVQLQKAVAMDTNRVYSHIFLGSAYEAKSMCAEALNEFRVVQTLTGGLDGAGAVHAYATCGRTGDARKTLALLSGPNNDPIRDWTFVGSGFAALGEKDHALQWLEKAFENRDFFLTEIKTHPYFDSLRDDPRFHRLLARMNFPE